MLVDLTREARYALDTLLLEGSGLAETTLHILRVFELVECLAGGRVGLVAVGVSIGRFAMEVVVADGVLVNDSAETIVGTSNRSINERELSDIILVDHAEDGLLLDAVHSRVLDFSLSSSLRFVETVGGDELRRIVLR